MKDIKTLHNEAMDLALQADIAAKAAPKSEQCLTLYTEAFEKEREAALLADFMQNPEPGLSILYRSAASLAIQCGHYREAEQLIAVALQGRTLYKDGAWNTLCLPFDVTAAQMEEATHPLQGANYMVLDTTGKYTDDDELDDTNGTNQTGLVGSTLYLYFKTPEADSEGVVIPAGTPFIVKWEGDGTNNLVNPVFSGVTISATGPTTVVSTDEKVSFKGNYNPVSVEASESILFMGGDNTLYYPHAARTINAFRAWFDLGSNKAREFRLSFGKEGEASSINEELRMKNEEFATAAGWYTLDGRKLDGKPAKKGLFIYNGRKVAIK
ncbi:MAG: hypothetical protein K5896_09100 [Prevotella sp.]|nr:hypothetical protein [Prevotella sp.]